MNERIQELYMQAHIERRQEYFSSEVDPTIKSVSVTRHFDPDSFAELIVRECTAVCLAQRDPANLNYKPSERFAEAVKQHFGVEE